jgi:nitrogenase subunit NifH
VDEKCATNITLEDVPSKIKELMTNSLLLINVNVHHIHRRQQADPTGQCSSTGGTRPTVGCVGRKVSKIQTSIKD